jgi:FkbM family methyltransferase
MMDAITSSMLDMAIGPQIWPEHAPSRMARDFLVWRHLRVLRARTMRHVHRLAERLTGSRGDRPVRSTYGVLMHPNWSDRTYAYCHYGTYGRYLADLIDAIDCPFLFLDIGANQGLFSLIAARNPACAAVVALEPVPDTHARLARNFALNGLSDRAHALNFGLSDRDGTHRIATCNRHSGVATLEDHLTARMPGANSLAVELRTVSGIAPYLPTHLPIFVKIDVEGHEAVVIEQLLGSSLAERIVGIFYEHDRQWSDEVAIASALRRAGFAVARQYGRDRHFDALALPMTRA